MNVIFRMDRRVNIGSICRLLHVYAVVWLLFFPKISAIKQISQRIIVKPLHFESERDNAHGHLCTFGVKKGKCGVNSHLQTDVKLVDKPLQQLCFIWKCPPLMQFKYGLFVKECYSSTKSGSRIYFIKNGCADLDCIFTSPPPSTPQYSYNLLGARADMPTPLYADLDAYITCTVQMCDFCDCGELTPPRNCPDYTNGVHRNEELLSDAAIFARPECMTTTVPNATEIVNTTEPATSSSSATLLQRPLNPRGHFSGAWMLGTIVSFAVILFFSCR